MNERQLAAYLAGPDVFLPNAREHAARKIAICARYGIVGRPPLNEDTFGLHSQSDDEAWRAIFRKDIGMMEASDLIIANLTPFRGPSADAGTLVELGWFLGQGKPIFGYTNDGASFADRSRMHVERWPDPVPGLSVEGFGLPDNLMISGAVLTGGCHVLLPADGHSRAFDALDVFECCVAVAAKKLGLAP